MDYTKTAARIISLAPSLGKFVRGMEVGEPFWHTLQFENKNIQMPEDLIIDCNHGLNVDDRIVNVFNQSNPKQH